MIIAKNVYTQLVTENTLKYISPLETVHTGQNNLKGTVSNTINQ
jgi:hypothetical protein